MVAMSADLELNWCIANELMDLKWTKTLPSLCRC